MSVIRPVGHVASTVTAAATPASSSASTSTQAPETGSLKDLKLLRASHHPSALERLMHGLKQVAASVGKLNIEPSLKHLASKLPDSWETTFTDAAHAAASVSALPEHREIVGMAKRLLNERLVLLVQQDGWTVLAEIQGTKPFRTLNLAGKFGLITEPESDRPRRWLRLLVENLYALKIVRDDNPAHPMHHTFQFTAKQRWSTEEGAQRFNSIQNMLQQRGAFNGLGWVFDERAAETPRHVLPNAAQNSIQADNNFVVHHFASAAERDLYVKWRYMDPLNSIEDPDDYPEIAVPALRQE